MQKQFLMLGVAWALLLPALGQAAPAKPAARITPAQAEAAATKKIHGKAISAKYEFEGGHWQYAILVKNGQGLYEVQVNSTTGTIMDVEKTSPAEEAKEAAADKSAAKAHQSGHAKAAPATGKKDSGEKPEANESKD